MVKLDSMQGKGEQTLLEALRAEGHQHEAPCNGKGTCGKCLVRIVEGNDSTFSREEEQHLSLEQRQQGYRLACLFKPQGKVAFEWVNDSEKKAHAFLVETPVSHSVSAKGEALRGLQHRFGVAVDIGTTTVVASLMDMSTGITLATTAQLNPQKTYGLDVLSRITYQMSHESAIDCLKEQICDTLQAMVETLCQEAGLELTSILEMTLAANTAMLHFLLGRPADTLGKAPYRSLVEGATSLSAAELGLVDMPMTTCYLLPPVSAYIGGDISSGILTLSDQMKKGKHLFIDIGTNGEIVLFNEGDMVACSCAAGPAFEGMNLSFGMRAETGAVETLAFSEKGDIHFETIGSTPKGICGSGVFDLMSELIRWGLIGKTGRIQSQEKVLPAFAAFVQEEDGKKIIQLDLKEASITVRQNDIRQIQLAKGAVRSGIEALLKHFAITYADLDSVLIAGQFGKHLKQESLVGMGIIPRALKNKVRYLGNTAKTGAQQCLMDDHYKTEVERLSREVHYLELADLEGYERLFVACLNTEQEVL